MTASAEFVFPRDPNSNMNRIDTSAIREACLLLCAGLPDEMINPDTVGFRTETNWNIRKAMVLAAACAISRGMGSDNYHVALVAQGIREFGYPEGKL